MRNVGISPSRKWKETENNKMSMKHEFYFHNFHVDKNYEIGYTVKIYKFILQSSYFDI